MSNDLLNILSNSNKDIDNQKLMDYISGKLSRQEEHELEKELADNELMNDAVEGLRSIKDQHAIQSYVEQLNKNLHTQLQHKKAKRQKRKLRDQPFVYIAIVLVLALIIITYMIIHKLQSPQ